MAAPIGWANRAHETTETEGGLNPYLIDISSADSNMVSLVIAAKQISGVGTGPWLVEYIVSDDNDFEIGKSSLEEGTGGGGEDRLMRDGTIYDSSNGGSAVVWGVGVRDVILAPSSAKMAALTDKLTTVGFIERTGDDAYSVQSIGAKGRQLVATASEASARGLLGSTTIGDAMFIAATVAAARALTDFSVGVYASIPGSANNGAVYFATDTEEIYLRVSSAWVLVAAGDALRPADEGHGNGIDADTLDAVEGADHLRFVSGDFYQADLGALTGTVGARSGAHGLTGMPRLYGAYIQCNQVEAGFSVGDWVMPHTGFNPYLDSSVVGLSYANMQVNHKTSGANLNITETYWNAVVWALK